MFDVAKKKLGFAFEGGGARGSYHMGVVKAFIEEGYEIHGVVGTSIGAINAAMIASGEFDKAMEIWESISLEHLFDSEFIDVLKVDKEITGKISTAVKKWFTDGGIDHSRIREFLATYIDEEKVRKSGIDFGLVTFSLSERKAYEIFLDDIPEGKLIDYILASAKLPIFTPLQIEDNRFIDGAFANSCPINMLIEKDYDEIIAVRIKSFGIFKPFDKKANVVVIETPESLGHFLDFTADNAKRNIQIGYCDGLRAIRKLNGSEFYLDNCQINMLVNNLFNIDEEDLAQMPYFKKDVLDLKRCLFEVVIPDLGDYLGLDKKFTYNEFVMAMLEYVASLKQIDRFEVYDFFEFCNLVRNLPTIRVASLLVRVGIEIYEKKSTLVERLLNKILEPIDVEI